MSETGKIRLVSYNRHPLTGEAEPFVVDADPGESVASLIARMRRATRNDRWRLTGTLIQEGDDE